MLAKFITEVTTRFNPFTPSARAARLFLARLPPDARNSVKIKTTMLPSDSTEQASLQLKFSTFLSMALESVRFRRNSWANLQLQRTARRWTWIWAR